MFKINVTNEYWFYFKVFKYVLLFLDTENLDMNIISYNSRNSNSNIYNTNCMAATKRG